MPGLPVRHLVALSDGTDRSAGRPERIGQRNMTSPLSLGVIGCGYWGPLLVRNFVNLPNCNVAAVCDANEARLKHVRGLYPSVACVTDYNKVFTEFNVDAIVIATPVKYHYPLAKA